MDRPLQAEKDVVRIPLYSDDNQRQYVAGTLTQVETDAILVNCFATQNKQTGEWIVEKRQGLTTSSFSLSGLVTNANNCVPLALISCTTVNLTFICAVADLTDGKLYVIAFGGVHGSGVVIGSVAGWGNGLNKVFLTEITLADVPYVCLAAQNYLGTSSIGYYAATTAGAFTAASLTQIVDVDYPGNIAGECTTGPFVQLNDHTFIMGRTGKIYNSDQGSISSWNAFGTQPASIEPDRGHCLVKYKQHLAAFGESTVEFFEDAGLAPPGRPLQRAEQAFIKLGTINASSVININDTIYWLVAGSAKEAGVYKLDQYTPVRISPPWINKYLYPLGAYLRLNKIYMGGRLHLVIAGITATIAPYLANLATFTPSGTETESMPLTVNDVACGMLLYSLQDNSWWGWSDEAVTYMHFYAAQSYASSGLVNPNQVILKLKGINQTAGAAGSVGYNLYDDLTSSNHFFDIGYDGTTEYGVCVVIQLAPIEFVTENRKAINKVKLIADAMKKFSGDGTTGNQIYLLYSKLDNDSTGTIYSRAISIPSVNHRYYWNNLGMTRKLSLSLVCKTKMTFRARAFELHVTQATG